MNEKNKKDLIRYRINRAKETLNEVEGLINLGYYKCSKQGVLFLLLCSKCVNSET